MELDLFDAWAAHHNFAVSAAAYSGTRGAVHRRSKLDTSSGRFSSLPFTSPPAFHRPGWPPAGGAAFRA
jgi:hypothetical protein